MRTVLIFVIMAAAALPCSAATKMTVAQLEQLLASHAAEPAEVKHEAKSPDEVPEIVEANNLLPIEQDDTLSPQLAEIELTERLSTPTLYRLVGKYKLGAHAQIALEQLANRSALLKLPANEQPGLPAPDAAAQRTILKEARNYVTRELLHLPNFVAVRTTTTFEDAPSSVKYFPTTASGAGFQRRAVTRHEVTFRDGKEVASPVPNQDTGGSQSSAMESHGEFGAQAAVVLGDIESGSIAFDHWENTIAGIAAVYRYSVPRGSSRYEVTEQCRGRGSFHDTPGYQGWIALDPKTGAILRLTLEARWDAGQPISRVASVIEYGPVVLGRRRSLCPLRSLTFMVLENDGCARGSHKLKKPVTMINQSIFSNYQRFGSSAKLIFDEAGNQNTAPNAPSNTPVDNGNHKRSVAPATALQPQHP